MRAHFLSRLRQIHPRDIGGWLVFVGVLLVTCLSWLHAHQRIQDSAYKRFTEIAAYQKEILIDRMKDYEQVLLGAAGLFASSQQVTRQEWHEYVSSLRLHATLPGIQGVGYSVMVPARDKAAHEARVRAEGFPKYAISPPGERDLYSSIVYLEPFSGRNLRAFGYDMYSEPIRHAAMQRAADTQNPAWSNKVSLVQEDGKGGVQAGFLVYVPIYAKDKPLRTVEERRAALQGFVYSPFRAGDMLNQLYQDTNRLFELQLYAGTPVAANLLYETTVPSQNPKDGFFGVDLPVDIGGTHWTARFSSNARFNQQEFSELPFVLFLAVLTMESLLFLIFLLDARQRRRVEKTTQQLTAANRENRLMAMLTNLLQNCQSEHECYPILGQTMASLFPSAVGACYLLNHSETQLNLVSRWGDSDHPLPASFAPESCWAFRRGQVKVYQGQGDSEVRCLHVDSRTGLYYCIPLLAQGKVIGDLHMLPDAQTGQTPAHISHDQDLLVSVADTVSLSLSNLRLRNSLHDLSIRDSLTGLYNRRYMEESLEREIERAHRQQHEIAVIMLDVDHFKQLNDTYGHEAGDTMLKRLADQMKHFRSGSDVVCRYGGEEFVLILPGISFPTLQNRLETLRQSIEAMQVNSEGRILPSTTVSIGVARYPLDAKESAELIRLADGAMYRAKQRGRNRIEWVHEGSAQTPVAGFLL